MQTNFITDLYLNKNYSLRGICRQLGVSESNKFKISKILKDSGIEVHKSKLGEKIGDVVEVQCPSCKKNRPIVLRKQGEKIKECLSCATEKSHKKKPRGNSAESHYNWKGGVRKNAGYILVYLKRDNKYFPMTGQKVGNRGGYILEHRLVMAKHLGRLLGKNEIVHHINGDKSDNQITNLELTDKLKHKVTYQDGFRAGYIKACEDLKNRTWNGEEWV